VGSARIACIGTQAQLAVTTYLVDKLALRAGGEKDEDLADTVGVCTLRVRTRRSGAQHAPSPGTDT
jgi:DNA topoisomerase IB